MRRILPALLLLAASLAARPALAQAVRGELRAQGGRPVAGALVSLVDASGRVRATAMTDAGGRYVVQAPAPGTYTVRAERVGFQTTVSPAMALAMGETKEYRLTEPPRAIALEGLVVGEATGRRCEVRPDGGAAAALWGEARKALAATAFGQERRSFRFQAVKYERDLTTDLRVVAEQRHPATGLGDRPFASLPAEKLASGGYVQTDERGTFYYAPDAHAFLSDQFLETHCFRVSETRSDSLVGLTFQPVSGRRLPEIAGTLWIDPRTGELRTLEYRYVNLDLGVSTDLLGGRVDFEAVPGGGWIVRRWYVRMPAVDVKQETRRSNGTTGIDVHQRQTLSGIREEGGEVTAVLTADGRPVSAARYAALEGMVVDSARRAPLAGARVFVSGTEYTAVTDAGGRFRIDGMPEGSYTVSFAHPRLDSLGVSPPAQAVSVSDGVDAQVALALVAPAGRPAAGRGQVAMADDRGRAIPLERLQAQVARGSFGGFYDRAARGNGAYITREEIERLRPHTTNDLLRRVPGMEVTATGIRLRGQDTRSVNGLSLITPASQLGPGQRQPGDEQNQRPGGQQSNGNAELDVPTPNRERGPGTLGDCIPAVFVDGQPWDTPDGNLSSMPPGDIEGIEVYARASQAPAQYRRRNAECGIILVWLKQG